MKCTSTYPASPQNTNLRTIAHLRDLFGVQVGLSDHTMGVGVSVASVAFGATVIEKHFTLDKSLPGFDHAHALDRHELSDYIKVLNKASSSLTSSTLNRSDTRTSIRARRGVYTKRPLLKGSVLSADDFDFVRPSTDYSPFDTDDLIGMTLVEDIPANSPVTLSSLVSVGMSNLESAFKYWKDEMKEKNISN